MSFKLNDSACEKKKFISKFYQTCEMGRFHQESLDILNIYIYNYY